MKTTATTEAVSSPPEEKWHLSQQWRRNTSRADKKLRADWENDLQNYEAERKSPKSQKRVHAGRGRQTKWEIPVYAYLVAPNGTLVTLMNEPGTSVDGFGAESSGMNITLSDTAATSIQNVTGGYGTTLTGTYQADQTLGTFDNSSANGTWRIYFADMFSDGGDPVLNSFTLNVDVVPEPVAQSLGVFLVLLLGWTGFRWAVRAKPNKRSGESA